MASSAKYWRMTADTDKAEFHFPIGIKKIYCPTSSSLAVKYIDGVILSITANAGIIEMPNIGGYPNIISAAYQEKSVLFWIIETGPVSPGISKTIPFNWCTVTIPSTGNSDSDSDSDIRLSEDKTLHVDADREENPDD